MEIRADGSNLFTIEGVGTLDKPHAIQLSFIVNGAIQCGFCTPGFIMVAKKLLDENSNPTREDVRAAFQKNYMACRCTGYVQITDAVMEAAAVLRGEKTPGRSRQTNGAGTKGLEFPLSAPKRDLQSKQELSTLEMMIISKCRRGHCRSRLLTRPPCYCQKN